MLKSGYETRNGRIEILPLIDVVFLLLVYFIYAMTSMIVNDGIKVELPQVATVSDVERGKPLIISISEDSSITIGKDRIREKDLRVTLLKFASEDPDMQILIRGHRSASLSTAIQILNAVQSAGFTSVSFENLIALAGVADGLDVS